MDAHEVTELDVSYRVPNDFLALAGALLPPGAPAPRGVRDGAVRAVAFEIADVGAATARRPRGWRTRSAASA